MLVTYICFDGGYSRYFDFHTGHPIVANLDSTVLRLNIFLNLCITVKCLLIKRSEN